MSARGKPRIQTVNSQRGRERERRRRREDEVGREEEGERGSETERVPRAVVSRKNTRNKLIIKSYELLCVT